MIMFISGLLIGAIIGVGIMCLLQVAKDDEEWKYIYTERRIKNRNLKKQEYQYLLKAKNQIPLLMVVREYYDKRTNEIVFAEILFEIE